jgi:hypothetical protein
LDASSVERKPGSEARAASSRATVAARFFSATVSGFGSFVFSVSEWEAPRRDPRQSSPPGPFPGSETASSLARCFGDALDGGAAPAPAPSRRRRCARGRRWRRTPRPRPRRRPRAGRGCGGGIASSRQRARAAPPGGRGGGAPGSRARATK